jgi:phage anti-repressor protein
MELIKISVNAEGQTVVSARDLHAFLEVKTEFAKWCERMFEYDFRENIDFNSVKIDEVRIEGSRTVKREIIDYALTLNCAKEIAMIQRNERGKQARQYFIDCEMKLKAVQASTNFLPDELLTTIQNMIQKSKKEILQEMDTIIQGIDKGLANFYDWLHQEHITNIEERLEKLEELNFPALGTATAFVYITQEGNTDIYKIGQSTQPDIRTEKLNTGNSQHLTIIKKIPFINTKESATFEKHLQIVFLPKLIKGEWYRLNAQDLQMIDQLAYIYSKRVKENM